MEARSPVVANVGELVARCARAFGPRIAVKSAGRNLTYQMRPPVGSAPITKLVLRRSFERRLHAHD